MFRVRDVIRSYRMCTLEKKTALKSRRKGGKENSKTGDTGQDRTEKYSVTMIFLQGRNQSTHSLWYVGGKEKKPVAGSSHAVCRCLIYSLVTLTALIAARLLPARYSELLRAGRGPLPSPLLLTLAHKCLMNKEMRLSPSLKMFKCFSSTILVNSSQTIFRFVPMF